jgi:hypothetical protein
MKQKQTKRRRSRARRTARTPFQLELIRLIEDHAPELGSTSGRSLSSRLGKSSNHLWQILNRGMVPSGEAILDISRLLGLDQAETEGLILAAIETKGRTRSRDRFWITRVCEMVSRRDDEMRAALAFLQECGLSQAFSDWKDSTIRGGMKPKKAPSFGPG